MIIVGEKINTSLTGVTEAIKARDIEFIKERAITQGDQGADYIDVNCGTLIHDEEEFLPWLVEVVQSVVNKPCCIDSPNPLALKKAVSLHQGNCKPMINSITAEKERYNPILEIVKEFDTKIIALTIDDEHGMPEDSATRIKVGANLIESLLKEGIKIDDIYIDPLIQPVSTSSDMGIVALDTIAGIKALFPAVHFMCGLSNVSFGLPKRGLLNRNFLTLAIMAGLDGAILDPGNRQMMGNIYATEVLLDRDKFTKRYLKAFRKGQLEF